MTVKALSRAARLVALVVSPLVTAPTAAAQLAHGPLTHVRHQGSRLDPPDRFASRNDRHVMRGASGDDAAAAHSLPPRPTPGAPA